MNVWNAIKDTQLLVMNVRFAQMDVVMVALRMRVDLNAIYQMGLLK